MMFETSKLEFCKTKKRFCVFKDKKAVIIKQQGLRLYRKAELLFT